jgi:hypothetical protein
MTRSSTSKKMSKRKERSIYQMVMAYCKWLVLQRHMNDKDVVLKEDKRLLPK